MSQSNSVELAGREEFSDTLTELVRQGRDELLSNLVFRVLIKPLLCLIVSPRCHP